MTATAIEARIDRRAFVHGARVAMPLAVGFTPFALALGAAFASTDLDPWVAWSSSWIIFAGAAQAAAVAMLDSGDAPAVVIVSCLIINSRLLLYGASLRPLMAAWTAAARGAVAYFLTDAVYAIAASHIGERPDAGAASHRSFVFGAGLTAWASWVLLTGAGVALADSIPTELPLDLAAPLTFLLLLLPLLGTRAAKVSAVAAGVAAAVGAALPLGIGMLAGIVVGIAAGSWSGAAR